MDEPEGKVISFYRGNPFEGMTQLELVRLMKVAVMSGDPVPHKIIVLRWRQLQQLSEAKRFTNGLRRF